MRKAIGVTGLIGLSLAVQLAFSEDAGNWEKITDLSPDKKFGVRITCESEPEAPAKIDPGSIAAVDLVLLPSKKRVMELSRSYDGAPARIFWAQDSKWFALSVSEGPRVTDTEVYHRGGDEFEKLDTEGMTVDTGGDVRNQYIEPVRWLKPGTLVLTQLAIFRGDKGDSTIQFTAHFDQNGKFFIGSKKKIRTKSE
jgi:hypothetical protein